MVNADTTAKEIYIGKLYQDERDMAPSRTFEGYSNAAKREFVIAEDA